MTTPRPLLLDLAAKVRRLRAARNWSRADLSRHSGLSVRFLARVESGGGNISVLRLGELAAALGTDASSLLRPEPGRPRVVTLVGMRGAGKSTVGPRLAAALSMPFVELDQRVERATGLQLSEMFVLHGEDYYRQAERAALEQLLADSTPCVVAVGGGLVVEPESYALVRVACRTVWLRAEPEEHWRRVLAQGDTRPMADNDKAFTDLRRILAAREPLYRLADLTVETSGRSVDEVVGELLDRFDRLGDRTASNPPSR